MSRDGTRLAMFGKDGKLDLLDTATGVPRFSVPEARTGEVTLAPSPDGQLLAVSRGNSGDVGVEIWNVSTGNRQATIRYHHRDPGAVWGLTFTPDSRRLAIPPYGNGPVKLWDAATGNEVRTLRGTIPVGSGRCWLTFSPDGRKVVVAGAVVDADTGKQEFDPPDGPPTAWSFSPDAKSLAVLATPRELVVLDAGTGVKARVFGGHVGLHSVAFSPDGNRLAVGTRNGTVKILDALTGAELLTIRGHTSQVVGLAFTPDGRRLFATDQKHVQLWDVTRPPEVLVLRTDSGHHHTVALSPDGNQVAAPPPEPEERRR